jgi:oxygen-independent coproporphyrinogen-3 oxidase
MAGIYVHIPFCREACSYCDFHFSIALGQKGPMLDAIGKEITRERDYLEGESLNTIYFGGGTPSLLSIGDIRQILGLISEYYKVNPNTEITLEANPDDLNKDYIRQLAESPVNRLSIGIQSFFDEDLEWMNRRHDSKQAMNCLDNLREEGFDNFNIDLIYGLPGQSIQRWQENLKIAVKLKPPHIAAYHLSYEAGTRLFYQRKKNRIEETDEKVSLDQFNLLSEKLETAGYEHYEISNFALPGKISRHNTSYWKEEKYLGAGPSAHSYNGRTRRWNISRNASYIRGINSGSKVYEEETLGIREKYHDYIMTSLRTSWGIRPKEIGERFGPGFSKHAEKKAEKHIRSGMIVFSSGRLKLSKAGRFIANQIITDLFMD